MKKAILILICATGLRMQAQVNIGANTTPNADAMLEISGSAKGFLLPRVALSSTASFAPLSAHVAGMTVYNTATAGTAPNNVVPGYYYNDGTQWTRIMNQANDGTAWYLTGTATDAGNTKANNIYRSGSVGIGTSPTAKLDVAASTTTNNTVVNATGSIDDFLQFNIQNTSATSKAQSGYSATADNGTATTGFAWMGINNSTFNYPTPYNIGGPNDVSYVASGQDMYIANANNSKSIIFSTGKATAPYFNERMRITNAGYVGIGTSTPAYPLEVTSTVNGSLSGYGFLNGSGVAGYNVLSSGTVPYSAHFAGRIICPEYNAQSDARIKDIRGQSNALKDLETLSKIKITDYEMKDKVQWGHSQFKKVIAQEVEAVFPQAVKKSTGFIPDIYQPACIERSGMVYILSFDKALNLNSGVKKIRIIANGQSMDLEVMCVPDDHTILLWMKDVLIDSHTTVFVYGQEVDDFRVVDYEALATLNISATQQIYKELKALQAEVQTLKKDRDNLQSALGDIEALKADMKILQQSNKELSASK